LNATFPSNGSTGKFENDPRNGALVTDICCPIGVNIAHNGSGGDCTSASEVSWDMWRSDWELQGKEERQILAGWDGMGSLAPIGGTVILGAGKEGENMVSSIIGAAEN
jgi:hypothetical protein